MSVRRILGAGIAVGLAIALVGCAEPIDPTPPPAPITGMPTDLPDNEPTNDDPMKGSNAVLIPVEGWSAPANAGAEDAFDYESKTGKILLNVWNIAEVNKQNGTQWSVKDYVDSELRPGIGGQPETTLGETMEIVGKNHSGYGFTFDMSSPNAAAPHGLMAVMANGDWTYDILCFTRLEPPQADFDDCLDMIKNIAVF
ncbi:MAG: hypothetical protein FWG08_01590 [Propionibacteriaceae bacterium]|nr:hypothetical protein [Propionibacteriaceae bacterium]